MEKRYRVFAVVYVCVCVCKREREKEEGLLKEPLLEAKVVR